MTNWKRPYSASLWKFATLLFQKLKILRAKLICSLYLDSQFLLSLKFLLSFWTYDVQIF